VSIRGMVLLSVCAGICVAASCLVALVLALQSGARYVLRVEALQQRYEVLYELRLATGDYAAAVAAAVEAGGGQTAELGQLRIEIVRLLAQLSSATLDEIATLTRLGEVQQQLPDVENARRISEIYFNVDLTVSRVLQLQRAGFADEARELFSREVGFRVESELGLWIDQELANERQALVDVMTVAAADRSALVRIAAGIGVLSVVVLAAIGWGLYRAVAAPIAGVTTVAEALAHGQLDHRFEAGRRPEFVQLGQALASIADQLAARRRDIAAAGEPGDGNAEERARALAQANERLRAIDEKRAQFLADVSHELRTPLTILRGEADVALRGAQQVEDLNEAMQRVKAQAADMGRLLDDLIAFARADAESQQHAPEVISVENVAEAAVREATVLADRRELRIAVDVAVGAGHINADFRRLKQALVIGLDNAVKHSPPGGTIRLSATRAGNWIRLAIEDEGPGVSAEDEPFVFERFYRGGSEDDLHNSGLGIGLSIARDIVERHGGQIELKNRPTGGAVLDLLLPAALEGRA